MLFFYIIIGFLLAFPSILVTQSLEHVRFKGNVRDTFNHAYLTDTYVTILFAADSTVLAPIPCRDYSLMYAEETHATFHADNSPVAYMVYAFNIPTGDYLLRFNRKGYNELVMLLYIPRKQYGFAVKEWHVEDAMMQRLIERHLGEAIVIARNLLHQFSNTRRVLNAQGITETWINSVLSFVMLHIPYRWNKQPKEKINLIAR